MNPQIQERLNRDKKRVGAEKEKATQVLKLFPYELKSIDEIKAKIDQFKLNFFDITFPPQDSSAFCAEEEEKYPFKYEIHWRRVDEFMRVDASKGLRPAEVFYEDIEPNDIKQGSLGNCWFMCALGSLAERPKLVENLFITKKKNAEGVYRIKFCKNGEWVEVTIDDYFPCLPFSGPLFSRAHDNELWVLLIEKAYAKLHGNYFTLRGGFANEGMIDLTGCPSNTYDFQNVKVKNMIENGSLFKEMLQFDIDGYLLSASTPGEDRWTELGGPDKDGGLVPGHAYSVIQVKEGYGNKLVNIRNPWGTFEWDGAWSDNSELWTDDMKDAIQPILDANDGTFWMCFEDFIKYFRSLNVCRVRNWQENRIRGKFLRLRDEADETFEQVVSKWYYELEIKNETTKVFIGLHQEDERIQGVLQRRPFIDVSLAVIRVNEDDSMELIDYRNLSRDRQVELEVELNPGKYIVIPRTTGALMGKSATWNDKPKTSLTDKDGQLTKAFESVVEDVFRKFDLFIGRELSYDEFKSFYRCTGKPELTEFDFKLSFLDKYCSTSEGVTVRGLKMFFQEQIERRGEDEVRTWLANLGYDEHLINTDSRNFTLTFHCANKFEVIAKDAIRTDLDNLADCLIVQKELENGYNPKDLISRRGVYQVAFSYSEDVYSYSYVGINLSNEPIEITIDAGKHSKQMLFLPQIGRNTKVIQPGEMELILHAIADPSQDTFARKVEVTYRSVS